MQGSDPYLHAVNSTSQWLAAVMAREVVMIVLHRSSQKEREGERQHYRLRFFSYWHFGENTIIANEKVVVFHVGSWL